MLGIDVTSEAVIALLKIIAIDIVLSGDNAVVIAMATRSLPKQQQNKAIFIGTGGAVLLRILFAVLIVFLLQVPYVHLLGGILLLWIAYHVLVGNDEPNAEIQSSGSLLKAVWTIIMADAVMSLDNVVAVAGAAKGHIGMLAIGVLISIPIMIFGAKLIAHVMNKYTWIVYIGSGILAWTAGEMITNDVFVVNLLGLNNNFAIYTIVASITVILLLLGYAKNKKVA